MSYENILMELIVKGGDARGKALTAIKAAKQGDFSEADKMMGDCDKLLVEAHNVQTTLIQDEINGEVKEQVSLLMVHGQDHLMNAMTVRDLAAEFIELYKMIKKGDKE